MKIAWPLASSGKRESHSHSIMNATRNIVFCIDFFPADSRGTIKNTMSCYGLYKRIRTVARL